MKFSKELIGMVTRLHPKMSVDDYVKKCFAQYPHITKTEDVAYYTEHFKNQFSRHTPNVTVIPSGTGLQITAVSSKGTLFSFMLDHYPACCGAAMLHHFSTSSEVTVDELAPILDQVFDEMISNGVTLRAHGRGNRIIVMMVEERGQGLEIDTDVEPVDNPKMQYKNLWEYFHRQKKVNTRLMFNVNSGNVLHDMEVILK